MWEEYMSKLMVSVAKAAVAAFSLTALGQPASAALWKIEFSGVGQARSASNYSFPNQTGFVPISASFVFDPAWIPFGPYDPTVHGALEASFTVNGATFTPKLWTSGFYTFLNIQNDIGYSGNAQNFFFSYISNDVDNPSDLTLSDLFLRFTVEVPVGTSTDPRAFSYDKNDFVAGSAGDSWFDYASLNDVSGYEWLLADLDKVSMSPFVAPTAPVPEPTSWALMIGGFALVGATLRSRKTSLRVSYVQA
jgi:hypothetical protein